MKPLRIGVAGLGRAFTLMMPTFVHDPRVQLVAACDPQPLACAQFERDFQAPSVDSVEALCQRPDVDWVYVATPHQFHADHVVLHALPPEELREAPTPPKTALPKTALPVEDRSSAPLEFVL